MQGAVGGAPGADHCNHTPLPGSARLPSGMQQFLHVALSIFVLERLNMSTQLYSLPPPSSPTHLLLLAKCVRQAGHSPSIEQG